MLVSCSYCGGVHVRGARCPRKPTRTKRPNELTRFRSSSAWTKKSLEIRTRDKFLCQVCCQDRRYVFKGLEVHHIEPLVRNWELRLESANLITLCKNCHELAENGKIEAAWLKELAQKAGTR